MADLMHEVICVWGVAMDLRVRPMDWIYASSEVAA